MQQARQLVADSLAAVPEAVLVADADDRVQVANAQAERLLGADGGRALAGRPLAAALAAVTPLEAAGWELLIAQARRTGALQTTRARRGEQTDLIVRLAPVGAAAATRDGAARGLVVSLADVTRLTAAERSREEVLAFVTHDLRSPQASLVSMVELARFGRLPLPPEQVLEQVDVLARRTLTMADAFLQVAAAEALDLQPAPLDLRRPVQEALDEVAPQAQARGTRLVTTLATAELPVLGDAPLLQRACVNLLTNALKFGGDAGPIEVELARGDGVAVLRVRDRGPGLTPEQQSRLFRRYERGTDVDHQPGAMQGVGLGLVLVETVARRHGGAVSVASAPGAGACFELRIPLSPANAAR